MSRASVADATKRVVPAGIADVQRIVAEANARATPVAIEGGNTLTGMGLPGTAAFVLSTAALKRVKSYSAADLTVSVESGMTVRTLRTLLAETRQFVPIDAPRAQHATVGGTLAANWLSPRRHLYGRARDFVIGSQIVLADGTLAHAGGMVVKNVAGYDMSRLYVGSFGTLGILTSLNFKTLPMPQAARMLVARLPELTRSRAIAHVSELPIPPAAAWFVSGFKKEIEGNDGPEGRMLIFLEGSARLLDRATRDVRSALGRAGVPETTIIDTGAHDTFARTIDAALATIAERSVTYRFGGLPDAVEKRCLDALARAADAGLTVDAMGDVLNGDCYVRVSARDARTFAEAIEAYDDALHAGAPNAVVVASAAPIRGSLDVWGADPNAIERMQALKHRFDPNAILNRGRFIGGI